MKSFVAVILAIFLVGCVSTRVTPETVAAAKKVPQEEREALLRRWEVAVDLCNQFLQSSHRKTLPQSRVELSPEGMRFVSSTNEFPVHVRCNGWGDFLVFASMAAQERSDGFVVGSIKPHRDRAVDNSLFRSPGRGYHGSLAIASLILHEITHTQYELGTVSFWKGTQYYFEAVFLLRYRNHTMERLPYGTTEEFHRFILDKT